MANKVKKFDYYVKVISDRYYSIGSHEEKECERLKKEILRHVDGIAEITIEHKTMNVCEHCGCKWEPDENGNNECCAMNESEYQSTKVFSN